MTGSRKGGPSLNVCRIDLKIKTSCRSIRHTSQSMIRYQVRFVYAWCNTRSLLTTSELVVLKFQAELEAYLVD